MTKPPPPPESSSSDRAELTTQISHVLPAGAPEPRPSLQEDQVRVVPPASFSVPVAPRVSVWLFVMVACVAVGVAIGFALAR